MMRKPVFHVHADAFEKALNRRSEMQHPDANCENCEFPVSLLVLYLRSADIEVTAGSVNAGPLKS